MEAKCLVLLPGEYNRDGDRVVPNDIWPLYEAEIALVIDKDGNTTVIKNRWGNRGKVVPQGE